MALVLIIALFALLFLGVPVAIALGLSSTIAILWTGDLPMLIVGQKIVTSVDLFPLMAIPFFILAGVLMELGGISQRLINLANAITGHLPGGLALVAVVTSMFFAAVSGSSAATVAAIGSILIPAMINRGYHRNFAGGIQAISGELGVIIPPSIPMILYGVTTSTSIRDMFIAGIIPGILIGITLLIAVFVIAKVRGYQAETGITWADRRKAFVQAIIPLMMPVIILGGIYGGIFTPTEAGAVAVAYAFIVGVFVYKEIKWKEVIPLLGRSVITSAIILFIIANAGLFGWILSREGVPQMVASFFAGLSDSPVVFLLIINALLLIVGMFIETSVSIILLAPLLAPVAMQMGIDPVHFGIIMIVNLAIGMCTPPLGVNLYISCEIAKINIIQITKGIIPLLLVMIFNVLLLSYVPWFSMWLVELLR